MTTKRIIIATIEPPHPFGHSSGRWLYFLFRKLVERGHSVIFFSTYTKKEDIKETQKYFSPDKYDLKMFSRPHSENLFQKFIKFPKPYSYIFSESYRLELETELSKGFDVLHLEQLWTGWLGLKYKDKCLLNIHHLLAEDLNTAPISNLSEWVFRRRVFLAEKNLIKTYPFIRATSSELVPYIHHINKTAKSQGLHLAIDTSLYPFIKDENRSTDNVLSMIGNMNWFTSYSAAYKLLNTLWPTIKEHVPTAKLQIVGWGAKKHFNKFHGQSDISIYENVPDTAPFFQKSSALLYAPNGGTGMKVKILEAMAYGVPIITNINGIEGLQVVSGQHVLLGYSDKELLTHTINVLNNRDLQNQLRKNARAHIEEMCQSEKVMERLETIYNEL